VEHIGTVKRAASIEDFSVPDKQVNRSSNGDADYKTNALEQNNGNGTSYQPVTMPH